MKDLTQLMMENNVTDKLMYDQYQIFQQNLRKNHNFSMSLRMSFNNREQFVLAALGLNYLDDALTKNSEDPKQGVLFS